MHAAQPVPLPVPVLVPHPATRAALTAARHWAVAVSGGGDSMALALLAQAWATASGARLSAFTVDHGLRPESATDAARTADWLHAQGIPCSVLRWDGDKPTANVQARAREARYWLLIRACHAHGVDALLTGHTEDDQAETLLLALLRGSGLHGLAAMEPVRDSGAYDGMPALPIIRPLLHASRAGLRGYLRERGQTWLEDPGNSHPRYARTHARALVEQFTALGCPPARLAATAAALQDSRRSLDAATLHAARHCLTRYNVPMFRLRWPIAAAPDAVRRVLALAAQSVTGAAYTPRQETLARIGQGLADGRTFTAAGCLWHAPARRADAGRWWVLPEAVPPPAPAAVHPGYSVAPLGTPGWTQLPAPLRARLRTLAPVVVWQRLPAVWHIADGMLAALAAVPHIEYVPDASAPALRLPVQVAPLLRTLPVHRLFPAPVQGDTADAHRPAVPVG